MQPFLFIIIIIIIRFPGAISSAPPPFPAAAGRAQHWGDADASAASAAAAFADMTEAFAPSQPAGPFNPRENPRADAPNLPQPIVVGGKLLRGSC